LAQGSVITLLTNSLPDAGYRATTAEPLLRLRLFGQMQAEDSSGQRVLPRSRKTRGVLAILALARSKPVLRTRLTGLLWSLRAKEQARASLRQSVHELQRALGPQAGVLLRADRNHLVLLDDRLWVDACVLAAATVSHPEGLELFHPPLLDDLTGLDPAFDHWLVEQRESAMQSVRSVAEGVLAIQGETTATIAAAERLLSIDRVHEGAWQALIRAHLAHHDRAAARLAFERYTATMSNAGLAPSHETEALIGSMAQAPPATTRGVHIREAAKGGIRLAVLPPRVLYGDGLDGILSGLAEEITAALSQFRWISCVAGGAQAMGAGQTEQTGRAWQQLDLDFLLDITLQRSGNRIRIIVRLLDIHAGSNVVWARRFDRELDDALTLQGEIAAETAAQIDPELLLREAARIVSRGLAEPTAYDLVLRAIPAIYRLEPVSFRAAGDMLAAAVATDAGNAAAYAWWAYWHLFQVGQGWAKNPVAATVRAGELAERAVTLDPGDARALALVGHVRGFLHKRAEEACALHEQALSLNPNLPLAWCFSGLANSYLGRHDDAIEHITQAQRLSPHDPHGFFFDMALMMPHFLRGDFDKAVTVGRRAIELNPGCSSTYKGYLATLGHLRHDQEAARIMTRLLALEPDFSIRSATERSPMMRRDDLALYAEGLRRAGLREG
jgi:DNA-binding SARP family transcriptional activator/Flp pilus assembly protein TadD